MEHAIDKFASDIHLTATQSPQVRINGEISALDYPPLTPKQLEDMLHEIMTPEQIAHYMEAKELDFSFTHKARFRINVFHTIHGPASALRLLSHNIIPLSELYAQPTLENLTSLSQGLILITGPTGSGKSTTLASIIDQINQTQYKHILTIEDPVEFVHKPYKSLINQREIGISCKSFSSAFKSALREDPDVIVLGELRDLETIQLALTAAETGHLVLATLHTNSAAQTVNRIISSFPASDKEMIRSMLSNSLEAVISQRLAQKQDGTGRVPIFEILIATSGIRNMIREDKIPQIYSLMQIHGKMGMRVMQESALELLNTGVISKHEFNSVLNIAESENPVNLRVIRD
jgi:twitching motility protein PilT